MYKISLFLVCMILSGCALLSKAQVSTPRAVLLPEDRIYTLPANTEVNALYLDGKPLGSMKFPFDMKVTSPSVLVAQEEKLNKALLGKIKSDEKNSTRMKIFGGILALLGTLATGVAGAWFQNKFNKKV